MFLVAASQDYAGKCVDIGTMISVLDVAREVMSRSASSSGALQSR